MRLNITSLISLLLLPLLLPAQEREFRLLKSIDISGELVTSDKFGNCYAATTRQELIKYSPKGELLYRYNNISLGRISTISAINPLKLLVYYSDYSTIVLLDNTLSQTGRVNLYEIGSNQVSAVCLALDNNIWYYDEVLFKVRKIDERMNILYESEDLNVLLGQPVRANFLLEKDNFVYLNDPERGILVFDAYGTYFKTIPLPGLRSFQKVQDQLIFFRNGGLFFHHLLTFNTEEIAFPSEDARYAVIEKDRLFVMRKSRLDVYAY